MKTTNKDDPAANDRYISSMNLNSRIGLIVSLAAALASSVGSYATPAATETTPSIPLPEHPRPDLRRPDWVNLNGWWNFRFDPSDRGVGEHWQASPGDFGRKIQVPFPWGSPLSGLSDEATIGWYSREITVPSDWSGKRVFIVIGACDWRTTVWLDDRELGTHEGGYIPFEFELTPSVRFGERQRLVVRADDQPRSFKLEGKQGYGNARGIWQTVYLEARGTDPVRSLHFLPDIREGMARVKLQLLEPAKSGLECRLQLANVDAAPVELQIEKGQSETEFTVSIPEARLWSLEDPFIYDVEFTTHSPGGVDDTLETYFGMRELGVVELPGSAYSYVSLNGQPVYLQLTLDQAYNPEGFYTFPSDDFMRDEIIRSLKIGLNGMRVHVKTAIPRKLYWADRLGMLIMADIPNSWGEPTPDMKADVERTMLGAMERDFNHPAIFSWVLFNETWGLMTKDQGYTPATQAWVKSMWEQAKQIDPTRLIEDNSANRRDHVVTDLNTLARLPSGLCVAGAPG